MEMLMILLAFAGLHLLPCIYFCANFRQIKETVEQFTAARRCGNLFVSGVRFNHRKPDNKPDHRDHNSVYEVT